MIVAALGDSLTGGYLIDGKFVADPNGSYPALVAQRIGATQVGIVSLYGSRIDSIVENIGQLPIAADLLIVHAGTNDMIIIGEELRTLDEVFGDFQEMLVLARGWMPNARVIVAGLRDVAAMDPDRIPGPHAILKLRQPEKVAAATRAFNRRILTLPETTPVDLAGRPGTDSVELFPDAVHPSPRGVQWIAGAVLEALL